MDNSLLPKNELSLDTSQTNVQENLLSTADLIQSLESVSNEVTFKINTSSSTVLSLLKENFLNTCKNALQNKKAATPDTKASAIKFVLASVMTSPSNFQIAPANLIRAKYKRDIDANYQDDEKNLHTILEISKKKKPIPYRDLTSGLNLIVQKAARRSSTKNGLSGFTI